MSEQLDDVSLKIGQLSSDVSTLTSTVNGLATTIEGQNKTTMEYRNKINEDNITRDRDVSDLSEIVDKHAEIASHISPEYLPDIDKNHQFTRGLREKAEFWAGVRERLLSETVNKSFMVVLTLVAAGILYSFGIPEWAKKIAGL